LNEDWHRFESYWKKAAPIDSMNQYHSFWDKDGNICLHQEHGVKDQDIFADWTSEHFTYEHLEENLEEHDLVDVMMYMEYNHLEKNIKCYGHPCMLQHTSIKGGRGVLAGLVFRLP